MSEQRSVFTPIDFTAAGVVADLPEGEDPGLRLVKSCIRVLRIPSPTSLSSAL